MTAAARVLIRVVIGADVVRIAAAGVVLTALPEDAAREGDPSGVDIRFDLDLTDPVRRPFERVGPRFKEAIPDARRVGSVVVVVIVARVPVARVEAIAGVDIGGPMSAQDVDRKSIRGRDQTKRDQCRCD